MVFLNPAVLIGMLAAAIPVVIHLLNLKRLKKVEFSTLAFLKELQKSKIRRIKIKQWLLLLLRISIIALLVMAFARPTIRSVSFGNSAAKTTAFFLLDNSFSMSVIGERGTYFNQAKVLAKKMLDNFQDGDEVSVLFTSSNQKEEKKLASGFNPVKKLIDNSEISDVTKQHIPLLVDVLETLDKSKNFNKEVYFFSDFQKINFMKKPEKQLPQFGNLNECRFYKIGFPPEDVFNFTITNFKVNNQIFEFNKPVEFTITVKNNSSQSTGNTTVTLFINGKRKAHTAVKLAPGQTKSYILTTTLKEKGLLEVTAELEDDDILRDNKMYLAIYVPEKIKVLLAAENLGDTEFIELAINPETTDAVSIDKINLKKIASRNLKNYDIVMLMGVPRNNIDLIKDFLRNGGNIIFMPASDTNLEELKRFAQNLGLPVPESLTESVNEPLMFESVDLTHPLFSNLFRKGFKPKLDSPSIYKYIKIFTRGKGKSIIRLIDKSAFLSEFDIGNGKLMFFNIAPVLSWSDFPLKGLFAPLTNKMIYYLSAVNQKVNNVKTGDKIEIGLRKVKLPQIKIIKPGSEEFVELDLKKNNKYFIYSDADKSGIYKFYSGNGLIDYFAVNFDPRESDLTSLEENDLNLILKNINFNGKIIDLKPGDDFQKLIYQSRFGTELWKYFLMLALVLALLEMFISKSAKKDMQTIEINN